jgi:hypothetical protein
MAVKIPMPSLIANMNDLIAAQYAGAYLRLYSNNYTPVEATVAPDFTEAAFTGYAAVQLNAWPAPTNDGFGHAKSLHPNANFVATGGPGTGDLYGWFLTDASGTLLYAAERFSSAPLNLAVGVNLVIGLTLTQKSEF